jgi:hypothetical protein
VDALTWLLDYVLLPDPHRRFSVDLVVAGDGELTAARATESFTMEECLDTVAGALEGRRTGGLPLPSRLLTSIGFNKEGEGRVRAMGMDYVCAFDRRADRLLHDGFRGILLHVLPLIARDPDATCVEVDSWVQEAVAAARAAERPAGSAEPYDGAAWCRELATGLVVTVGYVGHGLVIGFDGRSYQLPSRPPFSGLTGRSVAITHHLGAPERITVRVPGESIELNPIESHPSAQ